MTNDPFTEAEHITIPRPHVPYGPEGIPAEQADADYLREAARKLEEHYKPFGSNLRATVVKLVRDAADAVEAPRTHLAAQEPTDGEVLAALNAQGVVVSPKMHPAPSLDYWGDKPAEAMRAALSAARAARRDEDPR